LKRYQRVILQNLGYKDQDINTVSEELRLKCKIYGNQAADRILRPEQVFRGFLVSTLTCQECYNVSSRHEYFLDMSLPVSVEKPSPPQRLKSSPDNSPPSSSTSFQLNPLANISSKLHGKKDKESGCRRHRSKRQGNKRGECVTNDANGDDQRQDLFSSVSGSDESESDADVEDNVPDDKPLPPPLIDANGNDTLLSPNKPEKCDDSPENIDKDSLDEEENGKIKS